MEEQSFFQNALADFTYETACGGAIRHLTDLGYTVGQIAKQLSFPVPCERVRRAVWQRLIDTEVILPEEPGSSRRKGRAVYVREYDKFGRASFRRVVEDAADSFDGGNGKFPGDGQGEAGAVAWRERAAGEKDGRERPAKERAAGERAVGWKEQYLCRGGPASEELASVLHAKTEANGREASYVSCDFGLTAGKAPEEYRRLLEALDERQREYVDGLLWEKKRVYHRLDPRMTEILLRLYGKDCWHGACYFLKTQEKIVF